MKTRIIYLNFLLLSLVSLKVFSQESYSVKGMIADTSSNVRLVNTSVSVLQAKDSILVKFTRAGTDGGFSIAGLSQGKYILLSTYPGYADYVASFNLDSSKREHDFGIVSMILKSQLLQDVIVKGKIDAIKIKGDTTEYNAGSFKVGANAKVEELLQQLPGIQVDQDGKITAQGQTVQKVLVDGEEFFGDDPTLVTKNLRADMVDKVQLYDKKSDQATFTGIDDGEKTKTINIQLKEDKKNGYFGKLDAGLGTDKFYQEQGMINLFKGKRKFSAYGTLANTGRVGLGWRESEQYGTTMMEVSDEGYFFISGGDDLASFDGQYNGEGIPEARTGGVHYDAKWDKDNKSINTNYKIGSLGVEGTRNTLSQNNLPVGVIFGSSDQSFDNYISRQKLDVTYQVRFDTTSTLKISIDGTTKDSETNDSFFSRSRRGNEVILNESIRKLTNETDERVFNASVFWTKKFRKKGRTFSLNVGGSSNSNDASGYLNSDINFYDQEGELDSIQRINQLKINDITSSLLRSNLTYTEPLFKNVSVVLNYGLSVNNSSADRRSYNQSEPGRYDVLDPTLSSDYTLDQLTNQLGANFNYSKNNKTTVSFGTRVSAVDFKQSDEYTGQEYKRKFTNWSPQARYQHRISQQKSFSVNYNGNMSQPSLEQIQPIRVNNDPLNISLGNPDLDPSFTHRVAAYYNSYKVLSEQSVWLSGSYSLTMDPIVNNTVTDSAGRNIYQAFNLRDKNPNNFYFNASLGRKIKKLDLNANIDFGVDGSTYYNLINNELNMTKSYNYSVEFTLNRYKANKHDVRVSFRPNYTTSESSLQKQINNNGGGYNLYGNFNLYLPGKFQIGTDGNYEYREKTESFNEDFRRFVWNAYLRKKFLKDEKLVLSATGYDLLNQNKGFSRSANSNFLTQTSFTNIRRYFIFSLVWEFNKMGGGAKAQ